MYAFHATKNPRLAKRAVSLIIKTKPVAYVIKQIIKFLGVKFHVRGKENIVKNSGSIVLINHQSVVDLCVLAELWPLLKRGTVIAKKEILYFGLFGITTWLWGTIFIDRKRSKEAQDILNDAGKTVKHLKANLFLFPEGHRHSGSTLLPFKKGAFHIAIATQLPIQPVVVSKYYFLNSKAKTFNSGNSYITILPPISTEGLTMDDLPKLKEEVYACMNKTYTTTSQEVVNEYVDSVIGK
ncbi:PREDICTED: 1-acyl-sn-glycerol-3-phosphate acyltransferase alpha [Dufourea novaeangliae]|uniref:1-acyl-sn-glycerol-3-phosphate acyltransferase alpha n=1 Tax=Dufourea novaeangliae TaxID=178035 RepID=UPI000767D576|nr:PREDICTED: 1-acyl-sn-glycerol-3-phosphate acyltransferase alpha [Dufourea novaeangliae]